MRYQKMIKIKDMYPVLCEEFENEKKKFLERGIEPQIFSNFPAHDLNRR